MRSFLSISMCLSLIVIISGCNATSPKPWGRGYSSFDEEYKSAPGVKADSVGYNYTYENNAAAIEKLRPIASDLVDKLDTKLSSGANNIYLKIPANTVFYNSFDYLIRDELRNRGYILSSSSGGAINVEFIAKEGTAKCINSVSDIQYHHSYLSLVIDVVEHIPSDFVGGFYDVKLDDIKVGGNVRVDDYKASDEIKIDVPVCPEEAE